MPSVTTIDEGRAGETRGFPLLGARLREARRAAGLSQAAAAERVGVLQQTWSHWEASRHAPVRSAAELLAVCNLLNADPAWLLGLTDVRRPWPPDEGGVGAVAEPGRSLSARATDLARAVEEAEAALRRAERDMAAALAALRRQRRS
jgi:transcriptional regulator with XRE-family HTH domain